MRWTKPEFQEITLNMEVTAYVNTEDNLKQISNLPSVSENAESAPAEKAT